MTVQNVSYSMIYKLKPKSVRIFSWIFCKDFEQSDP